MNRVITENFIRECLNEARYHEFCGDFDRAQAILGPVMNNFIERQNSDELNSELNCELFLVYGSVVSYQGLTKKEKYLQETALDFLTEARRFAFEIDKRDLVSECEKQIGLCYWRLGQHDNALAYFETALGNYSLAERETNLICLATEIYLIGIYFDLQNVKAAKKILKKIEPRIAKSDDRWLQLKFYSESAGIHLKLGDFASAIPFLEKAIELSEITKNDAALANALNNLALVYLTTGETTEGRNCIERAIEIFTALEHTFMLGMALETKAQVLILSGAIEEAHETIEQSIEILARSENYVALAESLWTRIEILAKSGEKSEVIFQFVRLTELIKNHLGEESLNFYNEKFSRLFYFDTGRNYYEKTENYRKHLIDNALSSSGASVTRAAQTLGISHQNTSLLLKKYPDLCEKHKIRLRTRRPTLTREKN